MYRMYLALKERQEHKEGSAMAKEISIAAGRIPLGSSKAAAYLRALKQKTSNLLKLFAQQEAKALVRILHYLSTSQNLRK